MTEADEFFLLDRENAVGFDVDVLDHAFAMQVVTKLHVIDAGLDARDLEALVVIDAAVLVVFGLVWPPGVFSTGDSCRLVIVAAVKFQKRMPFPSAAFETFVKTNMVNRVIKV